MVSAASEHDHLLKVMDQYSEKLRAVSRSYYDRKSKLYIQGLLAFGLILMTTPVFFLLKFTEFDTGAFKVAVVTLGASYLLMLLLVSLRSFSERAQVAQFEILPLQQALRRLLVRASKLESQSISDPDLRIIFDLRLAEAESSLALSDWVLSTQQSMLLLFPSARSRIVRERIARERLQNEIKERADYTIRDL